MNIPQHIRDHAVLGVWPINPAAIAFTGGTINGVTVGLTTPAAGKFTTIQGTDTTDASDSVTGALKIAGGVGIAKKLFVGTSFQVGSGSTTNAGWIAGYRGDSGYSGLWNTGVTPSTTNYSLAGNSTLTVLNAATTLYLANAGTGIVSLTSSLLSSTVGIHAANTTDSSSTTTGSLKTAGGLGVVKKAYFGDSINVAAPGTITVGTGSGTSAGLIAGYLGLSGYGALWSTSVTPTDANFALTTNGASTYLRGSTEAIMASGGVNRVVANATGVSHVGDIVYEKTITAPGTTGAQTINKTTGRVNFAAAATSLVVTNSLVTANSIIHVTKATNDATMRLGAAVATAGSFTIYADVGPAAECAVNFTVTN